MPDGGVPFGASASEGQRIGNFSLVRRVDLDYAPGMSVEKWKSTKTDLSVYWANFESPLLNSYSTIASEIFNDSGVPHTLEHLIFLGSEQYPYKGVLDNLANRAFAQGTNAWTANDHTAYTLTTAGSDGFLRMLPVYLDHVFFPTLTKDGFTTEVYHINGKGEDAGVVYSEMQGRENSSGDLAELELQRTLYPQTSAYRSETGGLMSALRVLTVDEIRKYQREYYTPHNIALVVCGPLDRNQLFESLAPVEQRLLDHGLQGKPAAWKRPFVETTTNQIPKIESSRVVKVVNFPEKDETTGEVMITWVGAELDDRVTGEALSILGTYLTDSAVSPIQKAFVERDDPYATDVFFNHSDKIGRNIITIYLSSVPTERLETLDVELVDSVFKKIIEEGIDMDRMRMVIERDRLKLLEDLETKPSDSFADVIITDFLYGRSDGGDLVDNLDDMKRRDLYLTYTPEMWSNLLRKYLIDNARVVVAAKPAATEVDRLKKERKALEEKRKQDLGVSGLKKLDDALEAAKKANDAAIPPEMLSKFKVPPSSSIKWIEVGTGRNLSPASQSSASDSATSSLDKRVQAHLDGENVALPFFAEWDHVNSNFITVGMLFSTAKLPAHLRPLLNVLLSSLFSLPVTRADGTKLTFEQVVKGLDEDTINYEAGLGAGSGFSELVSIDIKVEKQKYEKAITWLRDLIWGTEMAVERLKVTAAKLAQSLPEQKRDGRGISWALLRSLTHDADKSSSVSNSILFQAQAVPKLVERLTKEPQKVVSELEELRAALFRPENLLVSVAGDVLDTASPKAPFARLAEQMQWNKEAKPTEPVPWSRNVLQELGKAPAKKGLICPLPTIESSYAVFTSKGIAGFQESDSAALVVTVSVLNAMESYLWRFIRGAGLAYGASIRSESESQQIHFSLYRSPNSYKAFEEAKKVIGQLASGEMEIDELTLESAKSSLHFGVADSEGTVGQAANECFVDAVLRQTGKGRGQRLLKEAEVGCVALSWPSLKFSFQS